MLYSVNVGRPTLGACLGRGHAVLSVVLSADSRHMYVTLHREVGPPSSSDRLLDTFTPEKRSDIMSRVRSKDTRPELVVRRLLHGMGFRYRLHASHLPGKPDIVFARAKKIVFVHGCFLHGHGCRAGANRPRSNRTYWTQKLERNKARDTKTRSKLRRLGWRSRVIWECQIKDSLKLQARLLRFLGD